MYVISALAVPKHEPETSTDGCGEKGPTSGTGNAWEAEASGGGPREGPSPGLPAGPVSKPPAKEGGSPARGGGAHSLGFSSNGRDLWEMC